jgi:nuclear pore complex protein Nup155
MSSDIADGGLLELLEGKLAVLRFQIRIKEELELLIRRSEGNQANDIVDTAMKDSFPGSMVLTEESALVAAKEKLEDLQKDPKSISQLYNDFAVPYDMWEVSIILVNSVGD